MYSKAEKSNIKKEFWTSFGLYMKPIPDADGKTINWINYKTGIKYIYFRMDADTQNCSVAIEINNRVSEERKHIFSKFILLKNIFTKICGEEWEWIDNAFDGNDTVISKIYSEKSGVNVMKKEDWPQIISFFKERIIKLDEFWLKVKVNFE